MKKKTIFLLFFFIGMAFSYGQLGSRTHEKGTGDDRTLAKESVYIHYNKSLLFSGENLKYKFYCFDNAKKNLSRISKIGYVSLIAKDGSSVFNHKIRLDAGKGYSDEYIPTSVPTGSYKLVGYTNWMINDGIDAFFQSDIHIINPYQKLPQKAIDRTLDSVATIDEPVMTNSKNSAVKISANEFLKMSLNKSTVAKREGMRIAISALTNPGAAGSYSLSVHKINPIKTPSQMSSEAFFSDFFNRNAGESLLKTTPMDLPEFRGELISGTIRNKDTGLPAKNQRISLSLPGGDYLHKIAVSNDQGKFHFNFDEEYDNVSAALQVLSDDQEPFEIGIKGHAISYRALSFNEFALSKRLEGYILERSIQNQLENAYQEVKSDSVPLAMHPPPFYRKLETVYNLDDFTRFNGLPETIVEVIDNVATRRLPNGDRVFEVRPDVGVSNNNLLPMVFVDGLFIKRHQDIMEYNAKKIKTIGFSRGIYVLGPQTFQGILHIQTMDGNFYEDIYSPHIQSVDLFKPQPSKIYFNQNYGQGDTKDPIPDFRQQLLWLPHINLSSSAAAFIFYTSDLEGEYKVVLDGFDSNGRPITITKKIRVE